MKRAIPSIIEDNRVLAQFGISLSVFDFRGGCIFASGLAQGHLGGSPRDLETLIVSFAADEVACAKLRGNAASTLADRSPRSIELRRLGPGEAVRVLEATTLAMGNPDAPALGIALRDVTDIVEMGRRVAELERFASVGCIAASVAHEFNNIVTAILGWAQIVGQGQLDEGSLASAMEIIESNARRAKNIAGQLIGVSRPNGAAKFAVSVEEVLEDVLRLLSFELGRARIAVTRRYEPVETCYADPGRLNQVFNNIVRNAMDAMPDGGALEVAMRQLGDAVEVSLKDTGEGMDAATIERIFDPYFSTKRASETGAPGGAGLGLSVCRDIVKDHGGNIIVDSRPGRGSTFTVVLPVTRIKETASRGSRPAPQAIPDGVRILVVDDEPAIGEMIRTALTLKGVEVTASRTGEEALAIARVRPFEVAFVDFAMPGLSGRALADALEEIQPSMSVVFMSGREMTDGEMSRRYDFIRKPFDLFDIQRKLLEVLDQPSPD
ncbi:MAG: ATP-binding protein [Deltaproteobacteria bacterium]|nr:ATP-binding protein [Deltaproteobacteria bacterium]